MNIRQHLIIIIILILSTNNVFALPTAKVTIKVLDESGQPIENAKVKVYFEFERGQSNKKIGVTNSKGLFVASGSTIQDVGGCLVTKAQYYDSYCRGFLGTNFFTGISGIYGFRHWQPWNPTVPVVLKKIKNPIPLYKRVFGSQNTDYPEQRLPKINEYVGFDLIASDWVSPYGSGSHSDFLFKLEKNVASLDEYKGVLEIKFSNKLDGIQSYISSKNNTSQMYMPYHAPVSGYNDSLKIVIRADRNKFYNTFYKSYQNYFFRVRTELDKDGNIKSALYGEILGNIAFPFVGMPTAGMEFTYVLNPTPNDTNLEMGENLFGDRFKNK